MTDDTQHEAPEHRDSGARCAAAHYDEEGRLLTPCIMCTCGSWVRPESWGDHTAPPDNTIGGICASVAEGHSRIVREAEQRTSSDTAHPDDTSAPPEQDGERGRVDDLEWALETLGWAVADMGSGEEPVVPYEDADRALEMVSDALRRSEVQGESEPVPVAAIRELVSERFDAIRDAEARHEVRTWLDALDATPEQEDGDGALG